MENLETVEKKGGQEKSSTYLEESADHLAQKTPTGFWAEKRRERGTAKACPKTFHEGGGP